MTAIFIHGAGGGGWEWLYWKPVFEEAGWDCVARDLQPSPLGLILTRFVDYEEQVVEWSSPGCLLIGASMGGMLALSAAASVSPKAIVLINSVSPYGLPGRNYPELVAWSKGPFNETSDAMPDSDMESVLLAHHHWRDESGMVLKEISMGLPVPKPECPVLIIAGSEDSDVPPSMGERMAADFDAEYRLYDGMSHLGPLLGTNAKQVALDTLDWLSEIA